LKGGLSSLANDLYLNGKIGTDMDLDIPRNGFNIPNEKEEDVEEDLPSIMGVEDKVF